MKSLDSKPKSIIDLPKVLLKGALINLVIFFALVNSCRKRVRGAFRLFLGLLRRRAAVSLVSQCWHTQRLAGQRAGNLNAQQEGIVSFLACVSSKLRLFCVM